MSNRGLLSALTTSVMFGCGAVLAKIVLEALDPLFITFLGLALGFVLLIPFLALTRVPLFKEVTKKSLGDLLLASLVGTALPLFLVIWGLKLTTGIKGGMLIQFQTVAGVLFAVGLLRERILRIQIIGILIMLVGGLLIVTQTIKWPLWQNFDVGDIMVLLGAVGFGYAFTPLKKLTQVIPPLQVAAFRLLIGAVALAPFLLIFPSSLPVTSPSIHIVTILVVYIFTNFALGFFTVNEALRLLPAWRTVTILQTVPIFSTISAILLLGESFTVFHGIGGSLIIGGATLITCYQRS